MESEVGVYKRLMFAGDLHKRAKDITTIDGYVRCTTAVQKALMDAIKELNIDIFISLGDWYDKGYANDVSASLADYDLDVQMHNQLNGLFYGLIGNHIRLTMDNNPELHLIQPHPMYKSRHKVDRDYQIIKTPNVLRIKDVQISFMHHVMGYEDVLKYKPKRQDWAKYHIALFHTPYVVPNDKLINTNYGYNASPNSKIAQTVEDVDLAIVGDIHNVLGQFPINTAKGTTTMIVPGSLTNTNASEKDRHAFINIPIVTIYEDSTVKLEYLRFDLKTNLLTFKKKNVEESREKLKSLRGKPLDSLYDARDVVAALGSCEEGITSLNAFMRAQGYTDKDKALIRSVMDKPGDLNEIVKIYLQQESAAL